MLVKSRVNERLLNLVTELLSRSALETMKQRRLESFDIYRGPPPTPFSNRFLYRVKKDVPPKTNYEVLGH